MSDELLLAVSEQALTSLCSMIVPLVILAAAVLLLREVIIEVMSDDS